MGHSLCPDSIQLLQPPTKWDHHIQPGLWITNSGAGRAQGRGAEIIEQEGAGVKLLVMEN